MKTMLPLGAAAIIGVSFFALTLQEDEHALQNVESNPTASFVLEQRVLDMESRIELLQAQLDDQAGKLLPVLEPQPFERTQALAGNVALSVRDEPELPNAESQSQMEAANVVDAEANNAQLITQINNDFITELPDPDWSEGMQTALLESFDQAGFNGAEVLSVECKTTLCRTHISYNTVEDKENFLQQVIMLDEWNYEMIFSPEQFDPLQMSIFIARDNT